MTITRRVRCSGCGIEQALAHDEPGIVVQLPPGWKRVGQSRVGVPVIYCTRCMLEHFRRANEDAEQSR